MPLRLENVNLIDLKGVNLKNSGERGRNRTYNLVIKRQSFFASNPNRINKQVD
jgi:hypothetical protein